MIAGKYRARLAACLVCLTIAASGGRVMAHPTALTYTQITINRDRTIDVTFATLGDAIVTKLEAMSGPATAGTRRETESVRRILELGETLVAHIRVRADVAPVALRVTGVSQLPDQNGKVAVRFSGRLPSGASRLAWATTLVAGSYPLAVRYEGIDGMDAPPDDEAFEWLTGTEESRWYAIDSADMSSQVHRFLRSVAIGYAHIVPNGLDHILFVLGLFLLATRTRTVLAQVTAFTVAHSITLGLSLYGLVRLPSSIVEPLIALSIVYVAFENICTSTLTPWRLALVFAFGLLHGLGFAEALMALDLPRSEFLRTLVAFNLGVEAGQLSVILVAALALVAMRVPSADYRRLVVRPASIAIAMVGAFWVVERLM
ncbi:MAG: HupE/UreJ family protein [Acidobacteriota bacterium]